MTKSIGPSWSGFKVDFTKINHHPRDELDRESSVGCRESESV